MTCILKAITSTVVQIVYRFLIFFLFPSLKFTIGHSFCKKVTYYTWVNWFYFAPFMSICVDVIFSSFYHARIDMKINLHLSMFFDDEYIWNMMKYKCKIINPNAVFYKRIPFMFIMIKSLSAIQSIEKIELLFLTCKI